MYRDLRALKLQQFNKTCFGSSTEHLCFKAVEGDFSRLDHGAPIMHNRQLIALHSKTAVTAEHGAVTVGTLISHYYDWIVDSYYRYQTYTDTLDYFGKNLAIIEQDRKRMEEMEENDEGRAIEARRKRTSF